MSGQRDKPTFLARIGSGLDQVVAIFSPTRALMRRAARHGLSAYDAAKVDRTTKDWGWKDRSADSAIISDHTRLTARARDATRNTWAGRAAREGLLGYIVGDGITAKSIARNPDTGQEYAEWNRQVDWWWTRWASNPKVVDLESKRDLLAMQRWAIREWVEGGNAILNFGYSGRRDVYPGVVIQTLDVTQLDTAKRTGNAGRTVRHGVELYPSGAVAGYWVLTGTLVDGSYKYDSTFLPADRCAHFADWERSLQTLGVSPLAPILVKNRHTSEYDRYEVIAKRMEAAIGIIRKYNPKFGVPGAGAVGMATPSGESGSDDDGNTEIFLQPGMAPRLPIDEDVMAFNPQRPGNGYKDYSQEQAVQMGGGVGLGRANLTMDGREESYTSLRWIDGRVYGRTDPLQRQLVSQMLKPLRDYFISVLVLEGRVTEPTGYYEDPRVRLACRDTEWQGPAKPTLDPAKQAAADKIRIDYRLDHRRRIANRDGGDWRENFEQISDEQAYAEDLDPPVTLPDSDGDPSTAANEPRPDRDPDGTSDDPRSDDLSDKLTDTILEDAMS